MMFFYSLKILMFSINLVSVFACEKVYASDVDDDASGSALTYDENNEYYDMELAFLSLSSSRYSHEQLDMACTSYNFKYAHTILSKKNSCSIEALHINAVIDFIIKRKKRELSWIPAQVLYEKRKDAWAFFDMCLEKHTDVVCNILNTREFWCEAVKLRQKSFNVLIKRIKKRTTFNAYKVAKILTSNSNIFSAEQNNVKELFEKKIRLIS